MKSYKFILEIKWYKNDSGGDRRAICIDYVDNKDKKEKIQKILKDFRTQPMDINLPYSENKGKIPYSVKVNPNTDWSKKIFKTNENK